MSPEDNDTGSATDHDGSLDGAVEALSRVDTRPDEERGSAGASRDAGGRFKAREADAAADEDGEDAEPQARTLRRNSADTADPAEAEDDYVEIPGETEGAAATREKLSDLVASHRQAKALQAEVEQARRAPAMPVEVETLMRSTLEARAAYIRGLEAIEATLRPQEPDARLMDRNSPVFDPERYHEQWQAYQVALQTRQTVVNERARASKEQADNQAVLTRTRLQREWGKSLEIWPELKEAGKRSAIVDETVKLYGFSRSEVQAIDDHRVLSVLKDALAARSQKAAAETAKKVVSAKPKLVRGSARDGAGGRGGTSYRHHYDALTKSHSLDDAAAAIAALKP